MNTKGNFLLLAISVLLCTIAVAQNEQPAQAAKVVADKIIAVVGDKVILKSDIDNTILDMERQGMEVPPNSKCLVLAVVIT